MDKKWLEAIKAGMLSGLLIAIFCSSPLLGIYLSSIPGPYASTDQPDMGLIMALGLLMQCLCALPLLALPIAALTGIAAIRGARVVISTLNEAVKVSAQAALLASVTGACLPVIAISAFAYNSYGSASPVYLPAFGLGIIGALVIAILAFTGGLIYSVYLLNLRYVHSSPGQ